jgi:O-antigen ligase
VLVRILGAWMVIVAFVFTQFVEFTIHEVGSLDLSVQKIVGLVVFPVALTLMGYIRIPLLLISIACLMLLANSAAYVLNLAFLNPDLLSANVGVLTGFFGAIALYTALTHREGRLSVLGRVWVAFAVVTSIVVLGQTFGLLPLWAVPSEELAYRMTDVGGLIRGTGLRLDPNFQAFVLVLGLVFTRFYIARMKLVFALIIALGIVGTFSRMGLLAAFLVWVAAPAVEAFVRRKGWSINFLISFVTIAIIGLLFGGLFAVAPQGVQLYIELRISDVSEALSHPAAGSVMDLTGTTSAEDRRLIFVSALSIFFQNFVFGVGAYNVEDFMNATIGIPAPVHNTYLEWLVVGGLLGVLTVALYIAFIVWVLRQSGRAEEDAGRKSFVLTFLFAFGLMALFLTLNYNSIIWLPLVVALAHGKWSTQPTYGEICEY